MGSGMDRRLRQDFEEGRYTVRLNMLTPVWLVWDWNEGLPVARYPDEPGLTPEAVFQQWLAGTLDAGLVHH
jgi:hypothetical protein